MTWLDDEKSATNSKPVELFTFTSPVQTYRLTSYHRDFVYSANTYEAVVGSRSSLTSHGATASTDDFTVELPASHPLVKYYAEGAPPRELKVAVDRYQQVSGVALRVGEGYVSGPSFKGRMASFRVPGLSDLFAVALPSVSASKICQHILYDARCTIVRTSFDVITTVATIAADRKSITVNSIGGNPDQWAQHGELLFSATTERRTIASQVGTTISFRYRLPPNIFVADAVTVFAGCDHLVGTCKTKFNNVPNFGGIPKLPASNVFWVDIRFIKA